MAKNITITLKCSKDEYNKIRKNAANNNCNISSFLRDAGTNISKTSRSKEKEYIRSCVFITQLENELEKIGKSSYELKERVSRLWRYL